MSNGLTTPNSFPSIMCSRHRLEQPALSLPRKWITISEMLKEVGYNTVGMSSMNPWTSSYFGYDRGFDVFKDYMDRIDRDSIFESERMGKIKQMKNLQVDEKELVHIEAIINSMTPHERYQYGIINGSRRKRIAAGSGTRVQDVNRLLKNYAQVMKMMKKINKGGMRGLGRGMLPF